LQEGTIKTARMAQKCGSNTLKNMKIEYPSSRSQLDSFRDVSVFSLSPLHFDLISRLDLKTVGTSPLIEQRQQTHTGNQN
jgi:hypothetical protein